MWEGVTGGVGGLAPALEEIRRRVWTPLCAPCSLLEELGAERVKGLLLYGPPGCGKSYLAARLASGLSRRPPTIVSGPEIMVSPKPNPSSKPKPNPNPSSKPKPNPNPSSSLTLVSSLSLTLILTLFLSLTLRSWCGAGWG